MRTPVSRIERFAGYFVLLALAVLVVLVLVPGLTSGGFLGRSNFRLHIEAEDAADLAPGDKVVMNGIQIGEISGVDLLPSRKVRLSCSIYRKYTERIPGDSEFFLVPAAIVGRGKIDVRPGTSGPLASGMTKPGKRQISVTDRVDQVLVQTGNLLGQLENILGDAGKTLQEVNQRVAELEVTLVSLQRILDPIARGEGSLGKILNDDDLYEQIRLLVARMETSAVAIEKLSGPLGKFSDRLPAFTRLVFAIGEKLDRSLALLQSGLGQFPEAMSRTVGSLVEARKVLESVKRNFLIRGNLPRDSAAATVAPATHRLAPEESANGP